ncbi:MAG: 2,3-bisphosphoglycerate-independent phosphoglycerate mutase [Chloroflexi bacterium]|nr:2,3-bisphosphoglycerate-independent phosphoglycerate mutase [Chloroflexota bacterium]
MELSTISELVIPSDTKVVLLVMDGLGGLPAESGGLTELETARTPNLDRLADEGICGLHVPIGPGIAPGSGPAHLALFGYDPLRYQIGRGVLEAGGIDFALTSRDVAARGNFCTVDAQGLISDRRAGRIPTEICAELTRELSDIALPGVELFVRPVKEYRFVLVLRGEGLSDALSETDPQRVGAAPLPVRALAPDAERTAALVNQFVAEAAQRLAKHHPANMLTLRGFSKKPDWPSMQDVFGLRTAAIAIYPMYRGVSRLVGMEVLSGGTTFADEIDTLVARWNDFDFFFIHYKWTDSRGEDGDFAAKVKCIEEVDALLPRLLALHPDSIIVTGDHSTPAAMKAHSWHPVPALLWSNRCRPDGVRAFGERACLTGALGPRIETTALMPLALANAGRLTKYGA